MFFIQHWQHPEAAKFSIVIVLLLFAYGYYRSWKWHRAAAVFLHVNNANPANWWSYRWGMTGLSAALALGICAGIFFSPSSQALLVLLLGVGLSALCAVLLFKATQFMTLRYKIAQPQIAARLRSQSSGIARDYATVRFVLLVLSLVLLNVALMQPQGAEKATKLRRDGFELVFLLDVSRSMTAQDIAPSRLSAAKTELLAMSQYLRNDKTGLILFASEAFVQAPLTSDTAAVQAYVKQANPDMMPSSGTDLAKALWMAFELFEGRTLSARDLDKVQPPKHARVVVVLSDGESHGQAPGDLVAVANKLGVRIDSIGFGSEQGAQVFEADSSPMRYKGELVFSALQSASMRDLAARTGGLYQDYRGPYIATKALQDEWLKLSKQAFEREGSIHRVDLYPVLLYLAMILMCLGVFIGPIVACLRFVRVLPPVLGVLFLCVALQAMFGCQSPSLPFSNEALYTKLNAYIENMEFDKARALINAALADADNDEVEAILSINLAQIDIYQTHCEHAAELLSKTLSTKRLDAQKQALGHYGMARALLCLAQHGNDESGDYFAKAREQLKEAQALGLEVHKDIEQLFILQYPACEEFQKEQELSANSIENALVLPKNGQKSGVLCAQNPIFFRVEAPTAQELDLKLTLTPLDRTSWMDQSSLLAYSHVSMALIHEGEIIEDAKVTGLDEEALSMTLQMKRNISTLEPGTSLYVQLSAENYGEAKFNLALQTTPQCSELDDAREPNNDFAQASALFASQERLYLCPQNKDFFVFRLGSGHSAWLRAHAVQQSPFSLQLNLYDAQKKLITSRGPSPVAQFITVTNHTREEQSYYVSVVGNSATDTGEYLLQLVSTPPCTQGDTGLKPENNNSRNPFILSLNEEPGQNLELPMHICPREQHFFAIDAKSMQKTDSVEILSTKDPKAQPKLFAMRPAEKAKPGSPYIVLSQGTAANLTGIPAQILSLRIKAEKSDLQTVYRLSASSPMFYLPSLIPNKKPEDDENEDNKENKENNDQGQKDQNKEENPSSSPDEPSQAQDTPKGPGSDTQGHDSQPDPTATQEKRAAQRAEYSLEKDRVNDLLDEIEEGDKNLPYLRFSQQNFNESDKNW